MTGICIAKKTPLVLCIEYIPICLLLQVYGFTRDRSFLLRELRSDLGLLRGGISSDYNKIYLPTAGQNEVDCRRDLGESNTGCLLAGDIRVNEQASSIRKLNNIL